MWRENWRDVENALSADRLGEGGNTQDARTSIPRSRRRDQWRKIINHVVGNQISDLKDLMMMIYHFGKFKYKIIYKMHGDLKALSNQFKLY